MMKNGFSMLEVAVVMMIFGIIIVLLVSVYSGALDNQRLNEAAENIVLMIQQARSQTLASKDDSGGGLGKIHAVHIDDKNALTPNVPNRVVLFVADAGGYAFNPSDVRNKIYQLPVGMEISALQFLPNGPGERPDVYFRRLTGEGLVRDVSNNLVPIVSSTVTITSKKSNNTRSISINSAGVVQVN